MGLALANQRPLARRSVSRKGAGLPGFFVFSGDLLREARTRKGMTREQLALAADSSYPAIGLYETGHRAPTRSTLLRLAAALGVSPAELVEDDPAFQAVTQ